MVAQESARLLAIRALIPFVPCAVRVLVPHVSRAQRAFVPRPLCVPVPHVLVC